MLPKPSIEMEGRDLLRMKLFFADASRKEGGCSPSQGLLAKGTELQPPCQNLFKMLLPNHIQTLYHHFHATCVIGMSSFTKNIFQNWTVS